MSWRKIQDRIIQTGFKLSGYTRGVRQQRFKSFFMNWMSQEIDRKIYYQMEGDLDREEFQLFTGLPESMIVAFADPQYRHKAVAYYNNHSELWDAYVTEDEFIEACQRYTMWKPLL